LNVAVADAAETQCKPKRAGMNVLCCDGAAAAADADNFGVAHDDFVVNPLMHKLPQSCQNGNVE